MAHKRASKKQLKEWIDEEMNSSRMYRKYGYDKLARDERSHALKLQSDLAKR